MPVSLLVWPSSSSHIVQICLFVYKGLTGSSFQKGLLPDNTSGSGIPPISGFVKYTIEVLQLLGPQTRFPTAILTYICSQISNDIPGGNKALRKNTAWLNLMNPALGRRRLWKSPCRDFVLSLLIILRKFLHTFAYVQRWACKRLNKLSFQKVLNFLPLCFIILSILQITFIKEKDWKLMTYTLKL